MVSLFKRRPGLTDRVTAGFALISLVVALAISGATYTFARIYLVQERETIALNRTLIDARVVDAALEDGKDPAAALADVPTTTDSQALLNVDGEWFSNNVTVSPSDLPQELLAEAATEGAWQRFSVQGSTFLGVAIPTTGGFFVETFSFADLEQTLTILSWVLTIASILALILGGLVGRYSGHRLLRPLRELGEGARSITAGDLATRVEVGQDPDLQAISEAFNEMAEAVEDRIERERRFSGNVSHELRSPLTGIQGLAELLEERRDRMPEKEAALVSGLVSQVRRFTAMVLDLLEISRIGGDEIVQNETTDVSLIVGDLLSNRGLSRSMLQGEHVRIATDPRRLERIVANLIENAERHGGGVVAITVERGPETVRLMVDDAGPGVSQELAAQIFEPFTRGESGGKDGAGLGLAIVREQVRLLGGEVSIERSPQGGARFVVTLLRGIDAN
ncbi:MAG: HAMP domain-containing histidine kinase [Actinomycetia bacterium]|nr:HAMP domain-containing histidine kinase [Actinomycetes bacterium]